jgi:hypothetical protein
MPKFPAIKLQISSATLVEELSTFTVTETESKGGRNKGTRTKG